MGTTEAVNRVFSSFAAEYNARQMIRVMQGKESIMGVGKQKYMPENLKKLFNLSKDEVAFLNRFGLDDAGFALYNITGKRK